MNSAALPQTLDAIATLIERGDFAGAERRAQAALQSLPPHAEIWRLLAIAQLRTGRSEAARQSLQQARHLDPRSVEVLCNLATVLSLDGQLDAAQDSLRQALQIHPDHPAALSHLGRLRHRLGDYPGAAALFERAIRAQPGAIGPWIELANAHIAQHHWAVAEDRLRRALAQQPDSADAWYLLGYLSERQSRWQAAIDAYEKSLAAQARAQTAHNLGLLYDRIGDWPAAQRMMQLALRLNPDMLQAAAHLAFGKRRLCDWAGLDALGAQLRQAVDADRPGPTPFSFLIEDSTPAQQLRCARTFARQFAIGAPAAAPPMANEARPPRVGFVSSGFNQHATGLLIVELIERLRALPLHTVAFATTAGDGSPLRRRLENAFGGFHDVAGRPAADIVARIRAARIDLLIDVDGYCKDSLPPLFAQRPAPIQINYLAYPGSLGAPWYDYLIADRYVIAPAQRAHYDERLALLPRCYQPTDTTRAVPEAAARETCGLPPAGFVFCCFNHGWKYTPRRFALWLRILAAVPGSALWLLDSEAGNGAPQRLRDAARRGGVDPARLVFSPKLPHARYLARLRLADLFLDTEPYNAHTTASDALYAGCPVLTRPGDTFASRVAGSLNRQLGLDALNAADDEAYFALAVELATQPARLAELRERLRAPATRAGLFDMRAYAADFAALLTRIAERARRGEPPADISL